MGNNLEGSGRGIVEVLSQNPIGDTEESKNKSQHI
jgi:hypothetical protein